MVNEQPTYVPSDERAHESSGEPGWSEAWLFDVVQADASVALSVEFVLHAPGQGVTFHASVVRPGEHLISLVATDIAAPKPPGLEVRASGLWADIGIQTPFDHVTVDIEAFAVELDDASEVFKNAFGVRTPLGFELEWEMAGDVMAGPQATSYELPCIVHGELLLGSDVIEIDGWGWRSHRWGVPELGGRTRLRGRDAGGAWISDREDERELSMTPLGAAPVPNPEANGMHLYQHLARSDSGDIAWVRRTEPAPLSA